MKVYATREHEFSYGHRVHNHESKCQHLHGHNGKFVFHCSAEQLDSVGRVIDFSVIKDILCNWVEDNYDHKFLYWQDDPVAICMLKTCRLHWHIDDTHWKIFDKSFVPVPYNPTAENMCLHMLHTIAPALLAGTGVQLTKVELFETTKCRAIAEL